MNRLLLVLLPSLLAACADYALEAGKRENAADDGGGDDDNDSGSADTAEDDTPPPDGWAPLATLAIVGGLPSADGAVVDVEFVSAEEDATSCTVTLDVAALTPDVAADATEVWAWWEFDVVTADVACALLPATLGLGVGELLPDVRARLGADGYDDVADSLFGAYVRVDGGEVWTYGYAGTEADLAGDDLAAAPPPDGTYTLAPLYLLPLVE